MVRLIKTQTNSEDGCWMVAGLFELQVKLITFQWNLKLNWVPVTTLTSS